MDRGRVAPRQTSRRPGASSCRGRACRPSARRRLGNGRIDATRVGGHRERGNGRFRPGCATAAARHHDAHGLQIAADRFAPDAGRPFDAPQRPAQSPQRQDLVVFVVSQDVAHAVRNAAFLVGVNASSRYSKWPVFSCPLIAGFGCPPTVDAKMPVWLSSRCGPRAARCTGNDSRVPDPLRPAMLISLNSMAALRGSAGWCTELRPPARYGPMCLIVIPERDAAAVCRASALTNASFGTPMRAANSCADPT
jgi:hypothetical protein